MDGSPARVERAGVRCGLVVEAAELEDGAERYRRGHAAISHHDPLLSIEIPQYNRELFGRVAEYPRTLRTEQSESISHFSWWTPSFMRSTRLPASSDINAQAVNNQ